MTLAFVDINSKLLDVASVADVDAEELVDDHLLEILRLRLENPATLENQDTFKTPYGAGP